MTNSPLTNFSQNDQLRVDIAVDVDYETDLEHARSVIVDAVTDLESVKSAPDPQVVAKRLDDSAIVLECRIWIGDPTMRRKLDARTAAIEAIVEAFDREGISIPYPQREHAARGETFRVEHGREDNEVAAIDD